MWEYQLFQVIWLQFSVKFQTFANYSFFIDQWAVKSWIIVKLLESLWKCKIEIAKFEKGSFYCNTLWDCISNEAGSGEPTTGLRPKKESHIRFVCQVLFFATDLKKSFMFIKFIQFVAVDLKTRTHSVPYQYHWDQKSFHNINSLPKSVWILCFLDCTNFMFFFDFFLIIWIEWIAWIAWTPLCFLNIINCTNYMNSKNCMNFTKCMI